MKHITIPQDFSGEKYFQKFGEFATVHREGFLLVSDDMTEADVSDCVVTLDDIKAIKIQTLWQAATDYEKTYISGSAPSKVGILAAAGNAECLEIEQWVTDIWSDYYSRVDVVNSATTKEAIDAVSNDFSNNGEIPHSVRSVLIDAS